MLVDVRAGPNIEDTSQRDGPARRDPEGLNHDHFIMERPDLAASQLSVPRLPAPTGRLHHHHTDSLMLHAGIIQIRLSQIRLSA